MLVPIGKLLLKLIGWRAEGTLPDVPKFMLIAAPHTSSWDLPVMLAIGYAFNVWPKWMGKKELFRWPFGWFMKAIGGIPIDRSKRSNMVEQVVEIFNRSERLILAVPPEGTRKKAEYWKTGFYYIALGAKVPVVMGFLDYGRKAGGFGPALMPTGDIHADFAVLREFYKNITPKIPENYGEIRARPDVK